MESRKFHEKNAKELERIAKLPTREAFKEVANLLKRKHPALENTRLLDRIAELTYMIGKKVVEDEKLWQKIEQVAKEAQKVREWPEIALLVKIRLPELFDKIRSMPEYREYLWILYEYGLYPHIIEDLLHGPPEAPMPVGGRSSLGGWRRS